MLSKIRSCGLMGIDGYIVEVETDIGNGIPGFEIVGLADVAVKESKERVKAAIRNSSFDFPVRRITVNLAPASKKKEGSSFDLPIALGILSATGQVDTREIEKYLFIGELSLDGKLKPVNGILPVAVCAMQQGVENLILPCDNAGEAAVVKGLNVLPARDLEEVVAHLNGWKRIERYTVDVDKLFENSINHDVDFSDVKGQESVKRALEVAASGGHNCLMLYMVLSFLLLLLLP